MGKNKFKDGEKTEAPVVCSILKAEEVLAGAEFDPCGCAVHKEAHRVWVTDKIGAKFKFYPGEKFALMDGLVYCGEELAGLEAQIKAQAGE